MLTGLEGTGVNRRDLLRLRNEILTGLSDRRCDRGDSLRVENTGTNDVHPRDRIEDDHLGVTMEAENRVELVTGTHGRGAGLWDAMQAVFSPVGEDGYFIAPTLFTTTDDNLRIAREESDFASEQFMQWFIKEQVEEVSSMSDLLKVVERARGEPVDVDTVFQIGSTTKTFTGTAAMRLVEAGKLDLDTPLRAYLPDLRLRDDRLQAQSHRRGESRRAPLVGLGRRADRRRRRTFCREA